MIELGLSTLIKALVSIVIVLLLSLIAEWAGPRVAGIASGYPLGAAITLFFIGLENGKGFAARSALFTAAGLAATVAFVSGYLLGVRLAGSRGRRTALPVSISLGLVAYGSCAGLLTFLSIDRVSAPLIAGMAIALSAWSFRSIPDVKIKQRIRLGFAVALSRAGFAAAVILVITSVAGAVGPSWAGIFSAFPITMLPLLAIIQYTYQPEHVRTIIKNVPRGLGSLLIYAMVVASYTIPLGIGWATLLGYIAATVYLILLETGMRPKPAVRRHT
ncbi:MAG TPA: hypothetical protein VLT88_02740 [Desulfosarcina sp.]|nr:hypothetical protein [Desulfosarcina sp.]